MGRMGIQCLIISFDIRGIDVQNNGSHMSMTSISPSSTALIRRSCMSWSTSSALKSWWWRTHQRWYCVYQHGPAGCVRSEHLGVFLHVSVCERALISKVTLLVEIHWSVRIMIVIACISTLCRGRIGCWKAWKVSEDIMILCIISYMISYITENYTWW